MMSGNQRSSDIVLLLAAAAAEKEKKEKEEREAAERADRSAQSRSNGRQSSHQRLVPIVPAPASVTECLGDAENKMAAANTVVAKFRILNDTLQQLDRHFFSRSKQDNSKVLRFVLNHDDCIQDFDHFETILYRLPADPDCVYLKQHESKIQSCRQLQTTLYGLRSDNEKVLLSQRKKHLIDSIEGLAGVLRALPHISVINELADDNKIQLANAKMDLFNDGDQLEVVIACLNLTGLSRLAYAEGNRGKIKNASQLVKIADMLTLADHKARWILGSIDLIESQHDYDQIKRLSLYDVNDSDVFKQRQHAVKFFDEINKLSQCGTDQPATIQTDLKSHRDVLLHMAKQYFNSDAFKNNDKKAYTDFSNEFRKTLFSKNKQLRYIPLWKTIVVNLLAGLATLGIAVGIKLVHSKKTTGRYQLFYHNQQSGVMRDIGRAVKRLNTM